MLIIYFTFSDNRWCKTMWHSYKFILRASNILQKKWTILNKRTTFQCSNLGTEGTFRIPFFGKQYYLNIVFSYSIFMFYFTNYVFNISDLLTFTKETKNFLEKFNFTIRNYKLFNELI